MTGGKLEAALRLSELCDALGHPARVAIIEHLSSLRRSATLSELCAIIPLAQSTVSQHVAQLRKAGLLRAERRAPRTYYATNEAAIAELRERLLHLKS